MPNVVSLSGGEKWKKALLEKYGKNPELHAGVLNGATHSGEYGEEPGQSVAEVAYWQEYGTRNIPPRPFFRNTIEEKKNSWVTIVENEVKRGQSLEQALIAAGDGITADIVETIKAGVEPALKPETLAEREKWGLTSKTPLMRSMTLIKAIEFEIKK